MRKASPAWLHAVPCILLPAVVARILYAAVVCLVCVRAVLLWVVSAYSSYSRFKRVGFCLVLVVGCY
jgi:hypothetical protein